MIDEVKKLDDALHVPGDELPEGFDAAPILDDWEFTRAFGKGPLIAIGHVAGDKRWRDGTAIHTSEIAQIDGRPSVRWIRTRNTLYRLGAPSMGMPLAAAVALSADWSEALRMLAQATGKHTLSGPALVTLDRLLTHTGANEWDWKRMCAKAMAVATDAAGRWGLHAAWTVMGANPRDRDQAENVHSMLDLAFVLVDRNDNRWKARRVQTAWQCFASGNWAVLGDMQDHIAAAHEVGKSLASVRGDAAFDMLKRAAKRNALFVQMALCRNWRAAADMLLDKLAPDDRAKIDEDDLFSISWNIRREEANRLAAEVESEFEACFRLLAIDPTDRGDAAWICGNLEGLLGGTPEETTLLAGWRRLAAGKLPTGECWDPMDAAWRASAERPAADVELGAAGGVAEEAPTLEGVVVLRKVGGTTKSSSAKEVKREFEEIAGKALPLLTAPDLRRAREHLADEFPHLTAQIDVLLTGLVDGEPVRLRHTLLVGGPGAGKSRLARRIAEVLQVTLHRFDAANSFDNAFGGTPRRWSTGEHCAPLEAVRRARAANPIVLIDEVDKGGGSKHNGMLDKSLLPFFEPETCRAYPDPYAQAECDFSHVNYLLTANDATALPAGLRDRLRIVTLPRPGIEHLPQIARTIVADIATARGGDPRWFPPLEDHELAVAESLWRGGSVRRLYIIVERLLALRESNPRN
ncbi:MAG TPA: AAA family ATPase [Pseudolabrys sp.]|nr:AAA family ATPase [Pseudolabrys sp.]